MKGALPVVLLSVFVTVSVALFVTACAIWDEWLPLVSLVPMTLIGLFSYAFSRTLPDSECEASLITNHGWLFLILTAVTSLVAMPILFWHLGELKLGALAMHLAADVLLGISSLSFVLVTRTND